MELIISYLIIGLIWTALIQLGLKYLDKEEKIFNGVDIGVNIIIWPYSIILFITTFVKEFINQ